MPRFVCRHRTRRILVFTQVELEAYLRRSWASRGCELADGERMGLAISELVAHSVERNSNTDIPYVDLWITILDEFISWQISLLTVLKCDRKTQKSPTDFDRSILMILMKIVADSTAIRHLILLGFDVQARVLLRSAAEYMELFVAIVDAPKLAQEFIKTDTPNEARKFWKTQLASGGIRQKIYGAWHKFFREDDDSDSAEWFSNWGNSYSDLLSGVLHPSLAGGLFTAVPFKCFYTDEKWLGVWGDKSEGSVDTVYTYASYFFPMVLLSWDFPFDGYGQYLAGGNIKYNKQLEMHRHVKIGRQVLGSLILSLGTENNRSHVFPEIDMSIWEPPVKSNYRRKTDAALEAHAALVES
jgi:hypothetical protein